MMWMLWQGISLSFDNATNFYLKQSLRQFLGLLHLTILNITPAAQPTIKAHRSGQSHHPESAGDTNTDQASTPEQLSV